MVAHQTVQKVQEGLDTLKGLVDLLRDPQKVLDLHAQCRKEVALTEAEEEKAEAARIIMSEADALRKDLDAKAAKLTDAETRHAQRVKDFEKDRETKILLLNDQENKLVQAQKEFGDKLAALKDGELKLASAQATFENWKKIEEQRLNGREGLLDKMAENQKQQQVKLDADTAAIRNKAARLQQAVAE